jgi:hypothetical protein
MELLNSAFLWLPSSVLFSFIVLLLITVSIHQNYFFIHLLNYALSTAVVMQCYHYGNSEYCIERYMEGSVCDLF